MQVEREAAPDRSCRFAPSRSSTRRATKNPWRQFCVKASRHAAVSSSSPASLRTHDIEASLASTSNTGRERERERDTERERERARETLTEMDKTARSFPPNTSNVAHCPRQGHLRGSNKRQPPQNALSVEGKGFACLRLGHRHVFFSSTEATERRARQPGTSASRQVSNRTGHRKLQHEQQISLSFLGLREGRSW